MTCRRYSTLLVTVPLSEVHIFNCQPRPVLEIASGVFPGGVAVSIGLTQLSLAPWSLSTALNAASGSGTPQGVVRCDGMEAPSAIEPLRLASGIVPA